MPELLLELLSEEIPARMQSRAAQALERALNDRLLAAGFMPEGVKAFSGPRRLTVIATGLPARQPDRREEKKGPRKGAPEKAIAGFLKSAGLSSLSECEIREDKKGEFYVAVIDKKGAETPALIAQMVREIINSFPWQKSMRWGGGELRWVRPLKQILCAFNGEVVEFEIGGVASSDETAGHPAMAPEKIQTRNFDDYTAKLRSARVILDAAERREIIAGDAQTPCKAQGLELVEDLPLLDEVAGLAEWPVAMMGAFDEKFLKLPDEVLRATMRGHQKYFSVRDPSTGRFVNRFIFVANIEAPDGGAALRAGYERVLTARLSDAWYLYHLDMKTALDARIPGLEQVTFFEGLGTLAGKARRMEMLAEEIARRSGADEKHAARAARLAKADLVSQMVYEFPELQGVMGGYYARHQGENSEIAEAISLHYKPQGQDDDIPGAPVAGAVAIADKLDTLCAFWAIGKKPTGSSDPFALRRAALGVIQIILTRNIRLPLRTLCEGWYKEFSKTHPVNDAGAIIKDLLSFIHDRLKIFLRETGHRHDHIDAVMADPDGVLQDDLVLIVNKLSALEEFLKSDDGENLAAAYKRAVNILKAEEKKDKTQISASGASRAPLKEPEERTLFNALEAASEKAAKAAGDEDFKSAMAALAGVREPIDAFFDWVTVNADEPELRANRLALLAGFREATRAVADFSKLEG